MLDLSCPVSSFLVVTGRTSRKVTRRFRRSSSQTDVASKWLRVVFSVPCWEAAGEDGVDSTWVLLYLDWSWTGPLRLISNISVLEQKQSIENMAAGLWAGWIAFFKWVPILNSGRSEMAELHLQLPQSAPSVRRSTSLKRCFVCVWWWGTFICSMQMDFHHTGDDLDFHAYNYI